MNFAPHIKIFGTFTTVFLKLQEFNPVVHGGPHRLGSMRPLYGVMFTAFAEKPDGSDKIDPN
ncbi:hypothetical protein OHAE_4423 [Ochrobactrum soli]|uniref:Uncharacterized protein n=1 Tax=Ochrobactrum soli TaxID=2448455 RepID=A0A2P9HC39_9HYPH|nr:hypothetical protein OHAE_4423 [[Ochrobactrum] soli]